MKKRTEEKIELALANANYRKWHRGDGRGKSGRKEENVALWSKLRREIPELEEEDGEWNKEMEKA